MAAYSSWSVAKLEKEKEKIEKAIASKEGKERKTAIAAMKAAAKKNGFDIKELLSDFGIGAASNAGAPAAAPVKSDGRKKKRASKRKGKKVAPKYRNPVDGVTWTGRGRKPKWVEAHIAKHGNLDKVTI